MENKKILNILLRDLSELEELVAEKNTGKFDELELDFLNNRIKGAKKLVQIIYEREIEEKSEVVEKPVIEKEEEKPEVNNIVVVEKTEAKEVDEEIKEKQEVVKVKKEEKVEETVEVESVDEIPEEVVEEETTIENRIDEIEEEKPEPKEQEETNLSGKGEKVDAPSQTLGDSFKQEKSVNDLIDTESNNLEQKLSNRPIESIQSAIGINDRFQYIRELFDGNSDSFIDTVSTIDQMASINEAVKYLQTNFNWKKNDVSLKFVSLVKRRFSNG